MTAPPAERLLNILLVEDDEVDVMNVRRAFKKNNIANPLFVEGMRAKGISKYIAYEVPVDRCRQLYHKYYRNVTEQLERECSLGVLDFDGRRIFLNFPLNELKGPVIVDEPGEAAA